MKITRKKRSLVRIYEERLNQVSLFLEKRKGMSYPRTLDLEQQSYFAIGYRQMCAKINADRRAAAAAKKGKRTERNKDN